MNNEIIALAESLNNIARELALLREGLKLKYEINKENELPFDPRMALKIDEIELSVRARNAIDRNNKRRAVDYPEYRIIYLGDLIQTKPEEILRIADIGRKTLMEFKELADEFNTKLGTKLIGFDSINIAKARKELMNYRIKLTNK